MSKSRRSKTSIERYILSLGQELEYTLPDGTRKILFRVEAVGFDRALVAVELQGMTFASDDEKDTTEQKDREERGQSARKGQKEKQRERGKGKQNEKGKTTYNCTYRIPENGY